MPFRVLFVCTGNICRSPTAEGVARALIREAGLEGEVEVDSAGMQGYHAGEAPDPRSRNAALARGYDISDLRARQIEAQDYQRFDLLLAMDRGHYEAMLRKSPPVYRSRIKLFFGFAGVADQDEVPDPYYGGVKGFDIVLDMCEQGVRGLLRQLSNDLARRTGS